MKFTRNYYQIKSNEEIFEKIKAERDIIGYYSLPYKNVDCLIDLSKNVIQNHIAVIGIGGSSLGSYAIHQFLKPKKVSNKKLHFFESTDPLDIKHRLAKIDLKDTLFVLVSKSGTTVETISLFKYFSSLVKINTENCIIISDKNSPLEQYAKSQSIRYFGIGRNVGGRFSVFSNAGLLPLALTGVDIQSLLDGCKEVNESFFNRGEYYKLIFQKARFLVENKNRFNINVVFSYSSTLEGFNKWYIQLWGESLGKININGTKQGLTPVGLIGPVDQHSFLQLINEGTRDKTVSFIKIRDFEDNIKILKSSIDDFVKLEYVNGVRFSDLISKQCNATIESIAEIKDIPYDVIEIEKVDEKNIAKLMYFYQLLTSVVGKFMQINTYNQPGVERGKALLKDKLEDLEIGKR